MFAAQTNNRGSRNNCFGSSFDIRDTDEKPWRLHGSEKVKSGSGSGSKRSGLKDMEGAGIYNFPKQGKGPT